MKTIYRCDLCGTEFDGWRVCIDHEEKHPQVINTHILFDNPEHTVPDIIAVEMNNGMTGEYRRTCSYPTPKSKE